MRQIAPTATNANRQADEDLLTLWLLVGHTSAIGLLVPDAFTIIPFLMIAMGLSVLVKTAE
jgi:hypothetical protein